MKTRRFFTSFFLALLLIGQLAVPARAVKAPDWEVEAKAALLVDQKTGAVLYALNEHDELYPASLTKIMTCLLVLDAIEEGRLSLSQEITATPTALEGLAEDGSTAGIEAGEVLTVEELLYCLMVVSANEAGAILAEKVSGSVSSFVDQMNARAAELGCEDTHFMNPHGYHDSQHYTTAWDLYPHRPRHEYVRGTGAEQHQLPDPEHPGVLQRRRSRREDRLPLHGGELPGLHRPARQHGPSLRHPGGGTRTRTAPGGPTASCIRTSSMTGLTATSPIRPF